MDRETSSLLTQHCPDNEYSDPPPPLNTVGDHEYYNVEPHNKIIESDNEYG